MSRHAASRPAAHLLQVALGTLKVTTLHQGVGCLWQEDASTRHCRSAILVVFVNPMGHLKLWAMQGVVIRCSVSDAVQGLGCM